MSWKSQDLKIVKKPKLMVSVSEIALAVIREQSSDGISANGEQKTIDWRDSGQLMDTAGADDNGNIVFPQPYSGIVNERFPFADIAPQSKNEYETRLQPVIQEGLVFDKEG